MGSNEAVMPSKSNKASSPVQEQPSIHPYPDWAAMQAQAYYGPGVSMPPQYFSNAVAAGHAPPPYMWAPQPLMTPYGTPYAAVYPHGGVYCHPSVPLGSHSHCQGIVPPPSTSEAVMATPLSIETPVKSPSQKDRGLMKKLKGFDGLAVSIGNGNAENIAKSSGSGEYGAEDSSDGNNDTGRNKTQRKSSSEDTQTTGKDEKVDTLANTVHYGDTNASSDISLGVTGAPANITGKPIGTVPSSSPAPDMEFGVSTNAKVKASDAPVPLATNAVVLGRDGVRPELWIQDERELKREKRKQSNRESARRSRLRKQAETEDLSLKVDAMNAENMSLRSEIIRLTENSEKLRLENSSLMKKLKDAQSGEHTSSDKVESQGIPSVGLENFLSRINNSSSMVVSGKGDSDDTHENSSGKLHQLLEPSPRTDAVAAG